MALSYDALIAYIDGLHSDGTMSDADYNQVILYILAGGGTGTSPRDLLQIRRGSAASLPSLAQGEFGYCLDTKELYIGGSTGNDKINTKDYAVNVLNFGAVNDGITDNTAHFQAAHDALPATGGLIIVPPGTWVVTGTVNISKPNVSIIGCGIGNTVINNKSVSAYTFNITGNKFHTADITYDSTVSGQTGGGHLYYGAGVSNGGNVNNCEFAHAYNGIEFNSNTGVQFFIDDCVFATLSHRGILVTKWAGNSYFSNLQINSCGIGIHVIDGWGGYMFDNIQVVNSQLGSNWLLQPATSGLSDLFFNNCVADTGLSNGFEFNIGTGLSLSRIFMVNCWASGNAGEGVHCIGVTGIDMNQIHCIGNKNNGIYIDSNTNFASITDPQCCGNSNPAISGGVTNTASGIKIAPNVVWFDIKGGACSGLRYNQNNGTVNNTIGANFTGFPQTQKYGIEIGAGTSDNYTVEGVNLTLNATGTLSDGGTGTNKQIRNCMGFNPVNSVVAPAIPSSGVSLTNPFGFDCEVYITGGSVSEIKVSANGVGIVPPCSVLVPAMSNISLTYSAAPSWKWFGK